jgi:hypothetical protein
MEEGVFEGYGCGTVGGGENTIHFGGEGDLEIGFDFTKWGGVGAEVAGAREF